ncbi:hypothetical protein B484DRAFT_431219 [Ochromonadaceae sp. CCMP2298]|nr:hypothetical protein B484DRAFT_431219 [Ochromonadaceae sp. CCMP2298]
MDELASSGQLWAELGLGGLVTSKQIVSGGDAIVAEEASRAFSQNRVLKKHHDLVTKPSFNVLMGRYEALPHKAKYVTRQKIAMLADPVKGRFHRYEKQEKHIPSAANTHNNSYARSQNQYSDSESGYSQSPVKRSMRYEDAGSPVARMKRSGADVMGGFFLTGGDEGDDENERYRGGHPSLGGGGSEGSGEETRYRYGTYDKQHKVQGAQSIAAGSLEGVGGRLAANLRRRVEDAQRAEKLRVPVLTQRKARTLLPKKPLGATARAQDA